MIQKESPVWVWSIFLLGTAYAVISILTISTYQVPWFDEVYYADAGWSFFSEGSFRVPVDYPRTSGESLHSPLFSVLLAGMFKLFGIGVWQVRILPLLSGLGVVGIMSGVVMKTTQSARWAFLFLLLCISDRVMNFSLHCGRMDMISVLFTLLSALLFGRALEIRSVRASLACTMAAGLLFAAGCLVAFRMALAAFPCVLLLFLFKSDHPWSFRGKLVLYGGTAVLPLVLWMAYGGVADAYETKSSSGIFSGHFVFLSSFVGNVFRRTYEIPRMLAFFGAIACLFTIRGHIVRRNFLFCILSLIALGFVLFVVEIGPYRAMFFPLVYWALVWCVAAFGRPALKKVGMLALLGLLGLNVLFSAPRMIYLAANRSVVNHAGMATEVAAAIPPGSRVVSEYRFYYALRQNGCDVLIPHFRFPESRVYAENEYCPDYFLGYVPDLSTINQGQSGTLGHPPAKLGALLERIVALERSMPGNHYHAQWMEVR